MENLIFSLNATMPVFLLMVLGFLFRRIGLIDDVFAQKTNRFVFKILLPLVLFKDLAVLDIRNAWDGRFVLFCFAATMLSVAISFLVARLWKDRSIRGEYVQASYRSSAAILGIAFIQNMYGSSSMAPLMVIGSVPLYNIMAVVVLNAMRPDGEGRLTKDTVLKTLKDVAANPIIIGIAVGFVWAALRIPLSGIPAKVVNSLSGMATPLGLIAMGASFDMKKTSGKWLPVVLATFSKLCLFVLLFMPLAIAFGFRGASLVAILVMLGSATTVSAYVMARTMGHEGTLTSATVALTTLLAAFTLTFWIYLLKTMGYI